MTRKTHGVSPSLKTGEDQCLSSSNQAESKFSLSLPFKCIQALNCLHAAHSLQGGQYALLGLPIQMLISPENTLTDKPRNND